MIFKEVGIDESFVIPVDSPVESDDLYGNEKKCVFKKISANEAQVVDTFFRNIAYLIGRKRKFNLARKVEIWAP